MHILKAGIKKERKKTFRDHIGSLYIKNEEHIDRACSN